jgi:hypothetical protein
MNAADDSLLDDLREMWLLADPPPPGLTASMIATLAAADLDREWELLVLVRDSADEPAAQVRGLASARILYFTAAEGWSLDAEIDGDQVRGQLLDFDGDMGSVEVALESRSGERWASALDEVGFFAITAAVSGEIRFTVSNGSGSASSRWIEV